jgi:pimeloyl-ACP methyl ester carboxylesterase
MILSRVCLFSAPALAAAFLMASCGGVVGLRRQVDKLEHRGAVSVQVRPLPEGKAATYALAWRKENGVPKDSVGFQLVRPDGFAAFTLDLNQSYCVGAFTDENGNRAYDAGEPFAVLAGVKPLSLSDPRVRPRALQLTLTRAHVLAAGTVIQVPHENAALGGKLTFAVGDVASLDEKRFAADQGSGGLWRPLDFLNTNAIGLYLTEPYDPQRIPVVFVYGIGGSPQDWRYFIEHFDRKRYQLWFYHYPSGMRLDRVSGVLAASLRQLKQRHRFTKCYLVAHSMGGLVARAAITAAGGPDGRDFIPKFVSISTPWGGHAATELGIRHLKKPVPSWLDVRPNGDFLLSLYAQPLPPGTTHDLIYGTRAAGSIFIKEENDGVVTVASETDPRIRRGARTVVRYPYGHVDILNRPDVVQKVIALLGR